MAQKLSEVIGWPVVETDKLIEEKAGKDVASIVQQQGWQKFRELEKEVVKKVAAMDKLIVAAGGGTVLDKENAESLKKHAVFVLLKAEPEVIKGRLRQQSRPALKGRSAVDEVEDVLKERMPIYESLADFVVNTDKGSVPATAKKILNYLKTKRILRKKAM